MMNARIIVVLLAVLLIPLSVSAQANKIDIVYSGNIDGELEPCGCSVEGDLGGILRHATTLKRLRKQYPDLFAISGGGLIVSMVPQDKLTGEYILKGFQQLHYDALAVQWNDLAYGEEFVLQDDLPWVSSNWTGAQFNKHLAIEHGGRKLIFFSWLDPAHAPVMAVHGEHGPVDDGVATLAEKLRQAQTEGLTVLSTTLTLEEAKALPLQYVDILLIRAAYEVYGEPQRLGKTLVLQPGSRGMRLGRLELTLSDDGRIADYEHEVISMPSSIENAPELQGWYDEYNAKVKAAYLKRVELRKALQAGVSPFTGAEGCRQCHQEEYAIWRTTLHSKAFSKLEKVNKAFDPACIKCHTVGFEKEGGFIDTDATPHLMNVQCESCHGAGRKHAESAGFEPTPNSSWKPQQICAQCHEKKHSPSFDFERYWPKIMHKVIK